jgi:hypothetical protein
LRFIEDQEGIEAGAELAGARQVIAANGENAAFALDDFDDEGAGAIGEGGFERGAIVFRNELDAGEERFKIVAVLGLAGNGKSA